MNTDSAIEAAKRIARMSARAIYVYVRSNKYALVGGTDPSPDGYGLYATVLKDGTVYPRDRGAT